MDGTVLDIKSAAIKHPKSGIVYTGKAHRDIAKEYNLPGSGDYWHHNRKNAGFELRDGTFINRDQALKRYGVDESIAVEDAQEKYREAHR
jgi:hypothetical protein